MHVLKYGVFNYNGFLGLRPFNALSTSNLIHNDTKIPGTTISPRPSILNFCSPVYALRYGNISLIGISRFLATVTITSVPYTQKIS